MIQLLGLVSAVALVLGGTPAATAAPPENPSPFLTTASVPALNPLATASSGRAARKAVDNDISTSWVASKGGPQWLSLDLRTVQTVTAVHQTFVDDQVWKFTIQGSLDGKEWVGLMDRSYGAAGRTFAESVSGQYRYVRMLTSTVHAARASSRELTVMVSPDGPDLAIGKQATASSALPGYEAWKSVDENTSTFWVGGSGGAQKLTVDLGSVNKVRRVEQQFKDADAFGLTIEGSVDGNTWQLIGDNSAGIRGQTFSFPTDGAYRFVRLSVESSPSGYWAASTSFKVFGRENLATQATVASADGDAAAAATMLTAPGQAWWSVQKGHSTGSPTLVIDLGGPSTLELVQAAFAGDLRYLPHIETSIDGRRWAPARVSKQKTVATAELSLKTATRFVRLQSRDVWDPAKALTGLELFGTPTNHGLSVGTKAQAPGSISGYSGKLAIDGNADTAWRADTSSSALTVDLGNVAGVRELEQTFETSGTWRFSIEGSTDGSAWDVLVDKSDGVQGQSFTYPANGLYRYLRLSSPAGAPAMTSSAFEARGHGSPVRSSWWEQMSGVRRYYAKYYGATLKELTAQLDTLRDQGYQIIEPFAPYEGPTEDFAGLGATNNYRVDPSIGTMEDLHELIAAAHARGMKVVSFINLGYSHITAPFFEKAVKDFQDGVASTERSWYELRKPSDVPGNCMDPAQRWYQYADPQTGNPTDVCFYAYWGAKIPSYNWNSPQWESEARKITRFWMGQGFDGMGFDAPEVMLNITGDKLRKATVEVLNNYDAFSFPEGVQPVCCDFPLPIAEQDGFRHWVRDNGFNVIQDLSTTFWGSGGWGRVLDAVKTGDASQIDDSFKQGRDLVNQYGGTTFTQPSWEVDLQGNGPESATDRLLEIATLTTAGEMFYLHAGFHEYQPEISVIPQWSASEQKRLADLMKAQASYAALDPAGLRVKLPTTDTGAYAYVRSDVTGGVKSLVLHNFTNDTKNVSVDLTGTGLSLSQTPVDLITGQASKPINGGNYTVSIPAKGSLILAVR